MDNNEIWLTIISGVFTSVISPIITPVFVKLSERIRKLPPNRQTTVPRQIFLQAGVGGVIGVALGYFVISPIILAPCPPFAPTRIEITSPISGDSVSRLTTIQGTACHIASNEELWLLVIPQGVTAYYPQQGPVVIVNDGTWTSSAYVGLDDPRDVGRGFVLVAALADNAGNTALRQYFAQASTVGQPGLEPLPHGLRLITQIQVTRK